MRLRLANGFHTLSSFTGFKFFTLNTGPITDDIQPSQCPYMDPPSKCPKRISPYMAFTDVLAARILRILPTSRTNLRLNELQARRDPFGSAEKDR